jgi:hypothetical protein
MPNLMGVVTIINAALQASSFSTQKFQGGQWNNIAEFVKESSGENTIIRRPVVVSDDGSCSNVSVDDSFPLVVYHRTVNLEYSDPEDWDFGDAGMIKREVASMVLIFFADRNRLNVTAENAVAAISMDIPDYLTNAQISALQLMSCRTEVESANINKYEVFEQEYDTVEYGLKPNSIMVSVPYKIISEYSPNCFDLCQ